MIFQDGTNPNPSSQNYQSIFSASIDRERNRIRYFDLDLILFWFIADIYYFLASRLMFNQFNNQPAKLCKIALSRSNAVQSRISCSRSEVVSTLLLMLLSGSGFDKPSTWITTRINQVNPNFSEYISSVLIITIATSIPCDEHKHYLARSSSISTSFPRC